jgi:hypothetical protein
MDIADLIARIQQHLGLLLDKSDKIVFSYVDTIRKGDLYTLDLNSRGEKFIPIRKTLAELPTKRHNSYTDEIWGKNPKYPKDHRPLQRNFSGLLREIGYDPSSIFSSNPIFTRSKKQHGSQYATNADICWKVHQ